MITDDLSFRVWNTTKKCVDNLSKHNILFSHSQTLIKFWNNFQTQHVCIMVQNVPMHMERNISITRRLIEVNSMYNASSLILTPLGGRVFGQMKCSDKWSSVNMYNIQYIIYWAARCHPAVSCLAFNPCPYLPSHVWMRISSPCFLMFKRVLFTMPYSLYTCWQVLLLVLLHWGMSNYFCEGLEKRKLKTWTIKNMNYAVNVFSSSRTKWQIWRV